MTCTLCELPVDGAGVSDEDVDGQFCCQGCLTVYRELGEIPHAEPTASSDAVELPADSETEYLAIDGMHCSTCELYLERRAEGINGVHRAAASYATETMRIDYDPRETTRDEIARALTGSGYTATSPDDRTNAGPDTASRLLVGGIFGMMAMTWYVFFLYPRYFGYEPPVALGTFDGLYLAGQLAILTAIILFYTGRPMLRGAYISVRTRQPNVDLLVTLAAFAAYLYSLGVIATGGMELYFDVTIVVVMAVAIGTYYESTIKHRTAGLLSELTELQVDEATLESGEAIAVSELEPGQTVIVDPGERIPVDGELTEGTAAIDESLVTGESSPVSKGPGDGVRGGTVVMDSPIVVEVGPEGESTLDHIVDMLWDIQATRPGTQRLADRLATVFVPIVLVLAVVVGVGALWLGATPREALLVSLAVLIVSCPCALGLATPLAVAAGLQSAASRNIVVTTPTLFEHGDDIETVVFDKTGTLTEGTMRVTQCVTDGADEQRVLATAAAIERHSSHPLADAIVTAGDESTTVSTASIDSIESSARGIAGTVDDREVVIGHPDFVRSAGQISARLEAAIEATFQRGETPVVVAWDETAKGVLSVGDRPRQHWEAVVEAVGSNRDVVVLTGDDGPTVDRFRDHPAITRVFSGIPPDGKAATVRRLAIDAPVAMVGDGSNDAPALAEADVGIALESGTKLATDAADAVVLEDRLDAVPAVFDVAGGTRRRIKQNLAWAFVYNGVAIPLAIVGVINPLFAALAMASSSLLVVLNSGRDPRSSTRSATDERPEDAEQPVDQSRTASPA